MSVRAVFFDVDFTLIYPGPMFQGEGYRVFGARHGMDLTPSKFDQAVASAAALLDIPDEHAYHAEYYVAYTRHIIEGMGGSGPTIDACAREVYAEWAGNQHFELYEEVPGVLRDLAARGLQIGLISNSHRCLTSFQSHFDLQGLVVAALSSSDHGLMKPHPSIFLAALQLAGVPARDAVMVGDSLRQDVDGALGAGMRAVLLHRGSGPHSRELELAERGVPVIGSLTELMGVL